MSVSKPKDPLHGITLERMLTELVGHFGWPEMGERIDIRCFRFDPSIKSSLTFLRKTPWARAKVEALYLRWITHTPAVAASPNAAVTPPKTPEVQ
ncbi:MAG: VF530 family protein [Opitutaceae bacterium]